LRVERGRALVVDRRSVMHIERNTLREVQGLLKGGL